MLPNLAAWFYIILLAIFLVLTAAIGERFWITAAALYTPPTLWFLPALVLLPLSFFVKSRAAFAQFLCVLALAIFWMPFRWSRWTLRENNRVGNNPTLVCVTNNVAENNHQSLQPFLDAERPDIIALQDAAFRGGAYQRAYPDRFVAERDQFILISKFPIRNVTLLPTLRWEGAPIAALFELDWENQPLVIYNVHMPTPRPALSKIMGGGSVARELLGHNASDPQNTSFAHDMAMRVELARGLAKVFDEEKRPFLAMGDFNAPDHGYVHRLIASRLVDAFKKNGRGFGWTFPGNMHNPLSLFGPWLRIDYLFAGRGFAPVYARTEPSRRSKHRAVSARFEMVK